MWECPDIIELDGHLFLVICPMQREEPLYQAGYFPLVYHFESHTYQLGDFHRLDEGFDYYAPQSFQDEAGRVIQMAWMGMPHANYHNEPTIAYGWQHALTMPKELIFQNGLIVQKPLKALQALRLEGTKGFYQTFAVPNALCFELQIQVLPKVSLELWLREDALLRYDGSCLVLDISLCGGGRKVKTIEIKGLHDLWVFSDTSSLEIFINQGEMVLTTRLYSQKHSLCLQSAKALEIQYYPLHAFKINGKEKRK